MKTKTFNSLLFILLGLVIFSCSKDDEQVDPSNNTEKTTSNDSTKNDEEGDLEPWNGPDVIVVAPIKNLTEDSLFLYSVREEGQKINNLLLKSGSLHNFETFYPYDGIIVQQNGDTDTAFYHINLTHNSEMDDFKLDIYQEVLDSIENQVSNSYSTNLDTLKSKILFSEKAY